MKRKPGFTLIEAMVVIVIIGILLSIGIPKLLQAEDRAKYANLKLNMTILRTASEVYSLDWGGSYAPNKTQLYNEGKAKKYIRQIKNPFLGYPDSVKDIDEITSATSFEPGTLVYGSSGSSPNTFLAFYNPPNSLRTYAIYAADKDGKPLQDGAEVFYMSNDH